MSKFRDIMSDWEIIMKSLKQKDGPGKISSASNKSKEKIVSGKSNSHAMESVFSKKESPDKLKGKSASKDLDSDTNHSSPSRKNTRSSGRHRNASANDLSASKANGSSSLSYPSKSNSNINGFTEDLKQQHMTDLSKTEIITHKKCDAEDSGVNSCSSLSNTESPVDKNVPLLGKVDTPKDPKENDLEESIESMETDQSDQEINQSIALAVDNPQFNDIETNLVYEILKSSSVSSDGKSLNLSKQTLDVLFQSINFSNFEGFTGEEKIKGFCKFCRVSLDTSWAILHHNLVGHKQRYQCPFDEGYCGVIKGAVSLHGHIRSNHSHIHKAIEQDLLNDVAKNTLSRWPAPGDGAGMEEKCLEACSVCLLVLGQPERSLHEMIVHGLHPPPSLLSRTSDSSLDEQVAVWWTGQSVAFCCLLCHNSPLYSVQPCSLPQVISHHRKSIHSVGTPLVSAWALILRLLGSLPAKSRRTMACVLSMGLHPNTCYGRCRVCATRIGSVYNLKVHNPLSTCNNCIINNLINTCNFCHFSFDSSSEVVEHLLSAHLDKPFAGWCPKCGSWAPNLLAHCITFHKNIDKCRFCPTKEVKLSPLKAVIHSINKHSFICPLPQCSSIIENEDGTQQFFLPPFSTIRSLIAHLLSTHFPDWAGLEIDQMNNLLKNCNGSMLTVINAGVAKSLDGVWKSIDGKSYHLVNNVSQLVVFDVTKKKGRCLLCSRTYIINLFIHELVIVQLCDQCELGLFQCENSNPPWCCPVSGCLSIFDSSSLLCYHLKEVHGHEIPNEIPSKCICSYVYFTSPLKYLCHKFLKHSMPCFVCDFIGLNSTEVKQHRLMAHGLQSWYDAWQVIKNEQLKYPQNSDVTPNKDAGLVKVWMSSGGLMAQWDPLIPISFSDAETKTVTNNINADDDADIQEAENQIIEATDTEDNLFGSYCSVSLSPLKLPGSASPSVPLVDAMQSPRSVSFKGLKTPHKSIGAAAAEISHEGDSSNADDSEPDLEIDSKQSSPTHPFENESNNLSSPIRSPVEEKQVRSVPPLTLNTKKMFIKKKSSTKESKGLGENAFIDADSMSDNILKDLCGKYRCECVECGVSVLLRALKIHLQQCHEACVVKCYCGFTAPVSSVLVHSFHMSHLPNEARPLTLVRESSNRTSMLVFEKRAGGPSAAPCFKCGKVFKQEKSRQLHYNLCKLEKKFECNECGEKFVRDFHLAKHKEWKHNYQKCPHCIKEFTSQASLAQHVLHIHKRESSSSLKCDICNETFAHANNLKVHSRIHSGVKPHSCSSCSRSFISRRLLDKHNKKKHNKAETSFLHDFDSSSDSSEEESEKLTESDMYTSLSESEEKTENKRISQINKSTPKRGTNKEFENSTPKKSQSASKKQPVIKDNILTSKREKTVPRHLQDSLKKIKSPSRKTSKTNAKASSVATSTTVASQQSLIASVEELRKIRQDTKPELEPILKANMVSTVESSIGSSRCKPCEKVFTGPGGKLLHLYLFHPAIVISQGLYQCGFCTYIFTNPDDVTEHHLQHHQRVLNPDGTFQCLCGLRFREDGAFYFHLYYAHKAQKALSRKSEIICRVCDSQPKLNKIVDLVVHLSDRHAMFDHVRVDQSFVCNFCYKGFDSWTVLSLHFFMVHSATKSQNLSYDCPYCETSSPWHSLEALQYHLDNFHGSRTHQNSLEGSDATPKTAPPSSAKQSNSIKSSAKRKSLNIKPLPAKKPPRKKPKKSAIVDEVEGIGEDSGWTGNPETLYCLCQCPYDEVSDMIGCDNQDCKYQWFHFECVGIMAAPEGNWYCNDCVSTLKQKKEEDLQRELDRTVHSDLYEYYNSIGTTPVTSKVPKKRIHETPLTSKQPGGRTIVTNNNTSMWQTMDEERLVVPSNSETRKRTVSSSSSSSNSSSSSSSSSSSDSSSSSGDSSSESDNE